MSATALIQIQQAQLGATLPLAYGYVRARGNNHILQELADRSKVAFYILGEKEWDGIERLEINGAIRDHTDVNLVHFHSGKLGTLGGGLVPSSNGPDQGVDNFFSLLPANYQRLTYSGMAYIAIHAAPDTFAPGPQLDVLGDYRACRVRIFDATGVQTAYQFSTNPVWQRIDLIIRRAIKGDDWDPAAAAAAGGDLTAAEKARFDWASIYDTAVNWCDFDIGGGIKRFESSVAFPQNVPLNQAMEYFNRCSQTYYVEAGGKLYIYADKPRASTFILGMDHVAPGSFQMQKSQLRGAPNRFIGQYNDLNPQSNCDIDTAGNNGLVRNGNRYTAKVPAGKTHPFLVGDTVQFVGMPDATFNVAVKVDTVPDGTTYSGPMTGANATTGGGYCGTVESRFMQRTLTSDHENHQLATGQRGIGLAAVYKKTPITLDFGNNTAERVQRLLNFIKLRSLGPDVSPYNAVFEAKVRAWIQSVDKNNHALIAQLPGDIITIDASVSEEFQGDYEIAEMNITPSTEQAAGIIELTLREYIAGAFSDVADPAPLLNPSIQRGGLPLLNLLTETQNGVVIGRSYGKNIIDNGGFEFNNVGTPFGRDIPLNGDCSDGWYVAEKASSFWSVVIDDDPAGSRTGRRNLLFNTKVFTLPNDGSYYAARCYTKAKIPVAIGDIIRVSGWIYWLGIAIPAGFDILARVGFFVFASDGTQLGEQYQDWRAPNTPYTQRQVSLQIPSTLGGGVPAYIRMQAAVFIANASGAPSNINTGWATIRFDDMKAEFPLTPFGLTPTSTTMTIVGGVNPLSQSGVTTTINVAANTMQSGDGQISYNTGTYNPGGYGLWFIHADDPTYSGGAVAYATTLNAGAGTLEAPGRVYFGEITTAGGGGAIGAGGGDGGGGPRGKDQLI
jgi:hypothetical protein